jgi:hypothetical protein
MNHSIFAFLVEGEEVRQRISNAPVVDQDGVPVDDIIIEHAEIFIDNENGVLVLRAAEGASGSDVITVTATDESGNSVTRTFRVTVTPDTFDAGPFMPDFDDTLETTIDTPVVIDLDAIDIEGDAVFFDFAPPGASDPFTIDMNNDTGVTTVTPASGFLGTFEILVGVRAVEQSSTQDTFDTQVISITVTPEAPAGVDLLASSDSGDGTPGTDSDNRTRLDSLQFEVSGVDAGATVTLFIGQESIGSAVVGAGADSAVVTASGFAARVEGTYQITATQTRPSTDGLENVESAPSSALAVTIDRTAPTLTSALTADAIAGVPFAFNRRPVLARRSTGRNDDQRNRGPDRLDTDARRRRPADGDGQRIRPGGECS